MELPSNYPGGTYYTDIKDLVEAAAEGEINDAFERRFSLSLLVILFRNEERRVRYV